MAKEDKKTTSTKYKAVNPSQFKEWYTDQAPSYTELSKGESVELNVNNATVKDWLSNNIIIKE